MSWLLVDNSNTRTKFALGDAAGLSLWRGVLPTASITADTLADVTKDLTFDGVVICSVVPCTGNLMAAHFPSAAGVPVHMLDCHSPIGIAIDYPEPERIGADRLANAAAVAGDGRFPAVVVDFGTAVTFDVISPKPAYHGGVIAPGLGAMTDYLAGKTALLPVIDLKKPRAAIGQSTVEAMRSGAWHGYRGLVKGILAALTAELGETPRVIATGVDAEWIARGMEEIHEVSPSLTLEGIRRVAARVFV